MAQYILKVKSTARRLTAGGETGSSTNLLNKLVGGLDSSFDTLKISLSLVKDLDEDQLTKALLSEESRRALSETTVDPRGRKRDRTVSRGKRTTPSLSKREKKGASSKYCDTCTM